MSYLVLKTIHLIAIVCWFAGLFYLGRLFIYHKEAEKKPENSQKILQEKYKLMANRLMNIITWPSTIITSFFGFYMLFKNTALLGLSWMKVKLIFVSILIIYTILSQTILNQLNKGTIKLNDLQLRLWNEGATLLLISIISLAVLKTSISWLKAIFVFLLIGITLMFIIKLYKSLLNK